MTDLNQLEYNEVREKIAKAIATAQYPYNNNGIFVNDVLMSREGFWNEQSEDFRNKRLLEAQAALDVMSGYGLENVMAVAFDKYLEEK
jgi:hypothetical protein